MQFPGFSLNTLCTTHYDDWRVFHSYFLQTVLRWVLFVSVQRLWRDIGRMILELCKLTLLLLLSSSKQTKVGMVYFFYGPLFVEADMGAGIVESTADWLRIVKPRWVMPLWLVSLAGVWYSKYSTLTVGKLWRIFIFSGIPARKPWKKTRCKRNKEQLFTA